MVLLHGFLLVYAVSRLPGFALDVPGIVEAVQQHKPKLVFLTSPNNPDGWWPLNDIDLINDCDICGQILVLEFWFIYVVVLEECFFIFKPDSIHYCRVTNSSSYGVLIKLHQNFGTLSLWRCLQDQVISHCLFALGCSLVRDEELETILKLPVLVILDEAYVEFALEPSRMQWVTKYENLVVLRTFSKRAGEKVVDIHHI